MGIQFLKYNIQALVRGLPCAFQEFYTQSMEVGSCESFCPIPLFITHTLMLEKKGGGVFRTTHVNRAVGCMPLCLKMWDGSNRQQITLLAFMLSNCLLQSCKLGVPMCGRLYTYELSMTRQCVLL